jgi:CRISPR-associated protein Csb1
MLSYDALLDAVENRAAFRRRRRLQPAGGPGDKLFPPTYPGEGNEPPRHVFERRRIDGASRVCVLVDSVQSQANRLEEALLRAAQEGAISLPRVVVDFSGADLPKKVRDISSLDAPHRVFDAILRNALLGETPFSRCSTPSVRKRRSPSACAQRSASSWSRRRSSPVPSSMSSCSSSAPSRSRARRSPSSSIAWGSPAPFATRSRRDWGQTPRFF